MSSYFSLPSFARAKKNKEELEKTNPQNPVLKAEDEKFLERQITTDEAKAGAETVTPTKITEDGEEKEATKEEQESAGGQAIVPDVKDDSAESETKEAKPEITEVENEASRAPESKTEETSVAAGEESVKQDETKDAPQASGETESASPDVASTVQDTTIEPLAVDGAAESKPADSEGATEEPSASKSEEPKEETKEATKDVEPSSETADDPPEVQPEDSAEGAVDDPPEQTPDAIAAPAKEKKPKKGKFDLPSQEEAEAATKGFNESGSQTQSGDNKSWTSYLPALTAGAQKLAAGYQKSADEKSAAASESKGKAPEVTDPADKRTWAEYASSAYSALPSLPNLPNLPNLPSLPNLRGKDSKAEPVYNEDGTVNEEKTKEKQEQEVSVLLDNLNLSSINNRVFAFSGETQQIYDRFAQVLKDTMNGAPTAYDDMETLMKDAGPTLEKQFASMPPFVQTLVKSLPAKLGTGMGPELLAMASAKPNSDMNARLNAASKSKTNADPSIQTAESSKSGEDGKKQKRTIPGLKGLVSEQGAVAGILRNVVSFLRVRFPFIASGTNVVMSLAVFSKSDAKAMNVELR